jgi:hypothetical protein
MDDIDREVARMYREYVYRKWGFRIVGLVLGVVLWSYVLVLA